MKKFFLLTLLPLNLLAQQGVHIEMKMSNTRGLKGSIQLFYDQPGRRMEFSLSASEPSEGHGMKFISLLRTDNPDTIFRINEKDKSYSTLPAVRISTMDHQKYTVKLLGEEKVNGYTCKHAEMTSGNMTWEVWNTKEIDYEKYGSLLATDPRWGSPARNQALRDAGADGFPIRMIQKSETTGEMTLELVNYEKKLLEKSLFVVPEGYQPMQRPEPGKGLQNMNPVQRDSMIRRMMQQKQDEREIENKK